MDVGRLIGCLSSGDLSGALNYAPRLYHQLLELKRQLPAGWVIHGIGFYSFAIGNPDSDRVWKISWRGNDPWIEYARFVSGHPFGENPLMPRIYRLEIQGDRAIAWMERLSESGVYHCVGMLNVVKLCRNQGFRNRFNTLKAKRRKIREYLHNLFDMRGNRNYNSTNLADIVVWMAGLPEVKVDCHGKNWMVRNSGQLVLTDPIG